MPDVPNVNTGHLDTAVLVNGQLDQGSSLADTLYQDYINADTISGGVVQTAALQKASAPISAVQYQQSVEAALTAFVGALLKGNASDINIVSSVINNISSTAHVPDAAQIQTQYNSDQAIVNTAAGLVTQYNDYLTAQYNLSTSLQTAAGQIAADASSLNGSNPIDAQITTELNNFTSDFNAHKYGPAQGDIDAAISLYDNNITGGTFSSDVASYLSQISTFYATEPPSTLNSAAWSAAQAAITARNNDSTLTQYYGTLANLPAFPSITPLASSPTITISSPPDSSSFGLPNNVSSSSSLSAVQGEFNAMITAAQNFETNSTTISTDISTNSSNLTQALSSVNQIGVPTMPSYDNYFNDVGTQIAGFITSSSFKALLGAISAQNSGAAEALATLLLAADQGGASVLFSNPSGVAVTGATVSTVSDGKFLQAYAEALAKELQTQLLQGGSGTQAGDTSGLSSSPNSTIFNARSGANNLATPPANPTSTNGEALLGNIPLLASDFSALLGQYSVLAAIQVLKSDTSIATQDSQTIKAEYFSALTNLISQTSATDLAKRVENLLQSQGVTLSDADKAAIQNTVKLFLTSFQGILANAISGKANLAQSQIGAKIASSYVQSTFKETDATTARQKTQQQNEQLSDEQIKELISELPQTNYLQAPAGLAQQALSGKGNGPNSSLGTALAGVLPKDANGNFESVSPSQLYSDLVAIEGQKAGSATFLQFIQSEPSYQLDEVTASDANRAHAGGVGRKLQGTQQATLASAANKAFTSSLTQNASQLSTMSAYNKYLLDLINNPTLSQYYSRRLLPGQNFLNTGLQVKKDLFANTPVSRNTTDFAI